MNARVVAARVVYEVVHDGRFLSDVLTEHLKTVKNERDHGFIQAISYGVCRWYFKLDAILAELLERPLKEKDEDIHVLLLVGLYQLIDMRIPDYAAVAETVDATKDFKKLWAKNLVNGVLRQYQRSADQVTEKLENDLAFLYSHADWQVEDIQRDWPLHWEGILEANNQHPPFSLRVNQRMESRENYRGNLTVPATIISETQAGLILDQAVDVDELPGFREGHISVQDGAAQLAAELLMLEPGQQVLDACAAPGGKSAHILEIQPDLEKLIAIDHNEQRLNSVRDTLQRLQLSADCICADASDTESWWDGKLFDRILVDAPCSATGVIRRHPDIKLLRRAADIETLVEQQKRLLNNIWQTLKPGGILLYATCSIFHEENSAIIKAFLETHSDAKEEKILASWGVECEVGRQILPGMHNMDGFYYARLLKLVNPL